MSIDWREIRRDLRELEKAQGLTEGQREVLAEAEAAIERGEPWMSQSEPEPDPSDAR